MLFKFLSFFLKTGIKSASFIVDWNYEIVIASLKLELRNFEEISTFPLIILKGISDFL